MNSVSELIQKFNTYEDLFTPIFLFYNGNSEIISLQYRLRTINSFLDEYEFISNIISQYLKNPIEIPSNLYSVQINDQKSLRNLAENQKYFIKLEDSGEVVVSKFYKQ